MKVLEWFFAFHRPVTLGQVWRREQDWRCMFGHVQAYGYTVDDSWLFFDPQSGGSDISITHIHDEVLDRLALIRCTAEAILAFKPDGRRFRVPVHLPMNCVTQSAALVGRRAFTPWGFRRMLLREGAEVIYEKPERGSEGQGSAAAGTQIGGT